MATGTDLTTSLEPCPLWKLAEYMRDGTWLDVRTDETLITRVRIVEMIVRVRGEDIVLRQEWFDAEQEWRKQQFVVDADTIWKVLPTNYKLEVVEPHGVQLPPGEMTEDQATHILDLIVKAALFMFSLTPEEFSSKTAVNKWANIDARYACMAVSWELTELGENEITHRCGYKSPMPLHSARQSIFIKPFDDARRDSAQRLARLVVNQRHHTYRRRAEWWPPNYHRLLP